MMDNFCAPQWADFTASPQLPSDSYFDIEHEVHEPHSKPTKSNVSIPCKVEDFNDSLEENVKTQDDSNTRSNIPEKLYFIPFDDKKELGKNASHNATLQRAMKNLKLTTQSEEPQSTVVIKNISHIFKTPTWKLKKPMSEKVRRSARIAAMNLNKSCNLSTTCTKITEHVQEEGITEFAARPTQKRASNSFHVRRYSLNKSQPKVLTCQYRRRSLVKCRRRSNQFISMAEAVSKFQTETPQRFRTTSRKDLKPGPLLRMKKAPLKLTCPISPALRCTQRTRTTNVLSQTEREMLELEEMKKHQIKANPVRANILKAPCPLKKVPKKPITIAEEFQLTQPKKTRHTTVPCLNTRQTLKGKEQIHTEQKPIPAAVSVNPPVNITKKGNNVATASTSSNAKTATRVLPFSFEARNKEFQIKKEEKLRNLHVQQTSKIKSEFHARPVPNFSKTAATGKEQQLKKAIVPCPFSFEERDKYVAKKKEELIKQMQEVDKKARQFHANPAPSFKPVLVHGLSKENLKSKEEATEVTKKPSVRHTMRFGDQENKQPNIITNTNTTTRGNTKKTETKECAAENKYEKKPTKNTEDATDINNLKAKPAQEKSLKPKFSMSELNTDKRAKERCEFEEKIRRKELEQEAKRQEEERLKLAREKQEWAELRKMAEVKARPMPVYKPMVPLKSTKPLISPQSPAWASRTKTKHVP